MSSAIGSGIGKGKQELERVADMSAEDRVFIDKMLDNLKRTELPGVKGRKYAYRTVKKTSPDNVKRFERLTGTIVVNDRWAKEDPGTGKKELGGKKSKQYGGKINRYARGGKAYANGPRSAKV